MGSFNTYCFTSQQVIAPGDRCRVIALTRQHTFDLVSLSRGDKQYKLYGTTSSTCYPVAFWKPVTGFMEAEYADYGQVALYNTPQNRVRLLTWANALYDAALVTAEGKNRCHDIPFDFRASLEAHYPELYKKLGSRRTFLPLSSATADEADFFEKLLPVWEEAWEVAQEHRLFLMNSQNEPTPMQYGLMHEEAFQYLAADTAKLKSRTKESYALYEYFSRSLVEAMQEARAHEGDTAFRVADRTRSKLLELGSYEGLGCISEDLVSPLWDLVSLHLKGALTTQGLFEHVKPLLEERYVLYGMYRFDLKFGPMVYAGQDYLNESGKAYAKFVRTVQKVVSRQRKSRYDE